MFEVTEKAIIQIKKLKNQSDENKNANLRVKIVGGGCSGLSYKMDFENKEPSDQDEILEFEDVTVVIDKKSSLFLKSTRLDFSDGLNGKGFEFQNPEATRTCGCGSSFSV